MRVGKAVSRGLGTATVPNREVNKYDKQESPCTCILAPLGIRLRRGNSELFIIGFQQTLIAVSISLLCISAIL